MCEIEIWKEIEGYDGAYMISNLGRVKSMPRLSKQNHFLPERIIKASHNNNGYCDVSLYFDGRRYHEKVHRLVAKAFVDNPLGLNEVDHIDTNKDNNRYDNLRWTTHSENHLNPLTVEKKRKMNLGHKWSPSQREKQQKKIAVLLNGEVIAKFDSYKALDLTSKEVVGTQLWNVYARDVIKGIRKDYKGFTFKEI